MASFLGKHIITLTPHQSSEASLVGSQWQHVRLRMELNDLRVLKIKFIHSGTPQ